MTVVALEQPNPREQWEERLRQACRKSDESQWEIGDAIIDAGEAWGDTYTLAETLTGKSAKTLRNYVYVCSKFDLSRRRDNLTFAHHDAVAGKKEADQDAWLDKAEKKDWSVADLKREMSEAGSGSRDRAAATLPVTIRIPIDDRRRWDAAAKKAKKELADWIVSMVNGGLAKTTKMADDSGEGASA